MRRPPSAAGDDAGQLTTTSRSPPSTCAVSDTAIRLTVPALGAVIAASIFIASMVAMVCPALTSSPDGDRDGDHAGERRGDVVGVGPVGLLRGGHLAGDAAVAHHHRPQLAVEDAHHRAHAALVGIGDRLQPDQQLDAALERHPVLVAVPQAVEELVGRKARGVAVQIAVRFEFLCRTGEQQAVQFGLTLGSGQRERRLVLRR